ncbi:head-tail connector protein [Sutcliffiella halmapala]|uniref:head-tail connector protein n=1 Tax=Sutcliffiella halmapala TaxID=79882 RepID=UPI0009956513|nr:head-tail connector protein [Sutcliffiella halmapala]
MDKSELLNYVKGFIRVDFEEDDRLISSLILLAEEYIFNATGYKVVYKKELEKLAVSLLVSHFYENRGIVSDRPVNKISQSIESILLQIEFCYGDS